MSAVVMAEPTAPTLFDVPGGEPTLDEVLVSVWEGLAARRAVNCPVCGGDMRPRAVAHNRSHGGACTDCGSSLA